MTEDEGEGMYEVEDRSWPWPATEVRLTRRKRERVYHEEEGYNLRVEDNEDQVIKHGEESGEEA